MATEMKAKVKGLADKVSFNAGQTAAEAIALGHFKDEAAILRDAYRGRNIECNRRAAELVAKGGTAADAASVYSTYTSGAGVVRVKGEKRVRASKDERAAARKAIEANVEVIAAPFMAMDDATLTALARSNMVAPEIVKHLISKGRKIALTEKSAPAAPSTTPTPAAAAGATAPSKSSKPSKSK